MQAVRFLPQILHATGPMHSEQSGQFCTQSHQASAAAQVVVVPSQVMEVPGTLVQEVAGLQLKVVP
jgi:hypothetical protein